MSDEQQTSDVTGSTYDKTDNKELRITRKDLFLSWLIWMFFSHSNYNYERLQATAFAHSMVPIIKRLYGGSKEETSEALKRHLVFFNTEPNFGGVIHGATIAMEEQRANGHPVSDSAMNSMKTGLMGPLAGLGDTIDQGIVYPLLLALGIGITGVSGANIDLSAQTGNPLGPIIYFVLVVIWTLGVAWLTFSQGYKRGRSIITEIFKSGLMDKVILGASILGNLVLGGLAASFVLLFVAPKVTVGDQTLYLQQDLFDKILPGILPLGLVLLTWWLLNKGHHPIKLLVIYLVVSIIGAIPLFGPAPQYVTDQCNSSIFSPYAACAIETPEEEA